MSKSKGNYYILGDLVAKGFSPMALRYALLAGHPRKQLNFTLDSLHAAESALATLRAYRAALGGPRPRKTPSPRSSPPCATTSISPAPSVHCSPPSTADPPEPIPRPSTAGAVRPRPESRRGRPGAKPRSPPSHRSGRKTLGGQTGEGFRRRRPPAWGIDRGRLVDAGRQGRLQAGAGEKMTDQVKAAFRRDSGTLAHPPQGNDVLRVDHDGKGPHVRIDNVVTLMRMSMEMIRMREKMLVAWERVISSGKSFGEPISCSNVFIFGKIPFCSRCFLSDWKAL